MSLARRLSGLFLSLLAAACASVAGTKDPAGAITHREEAPGKPAFIAADIAGRAGPELDALLGRPDLKRVEGAGEFRRYTFAECALIVILYPDGTGVARAGKLDAGALVSGAEKPDLDRCLAFGKPNAP
ncbi:MAG: hypothetical protein ACOZAA_08235 [Pseudomonadota bacterium]